MSDWADVATVLLGSWPTEVAKWGRDAIGAYCRELAARGLTPDEALVGIRSKTGRFPPNAAEVVQAAVRDPGRPPWDEAYRLIWGPRGVLRARPSASTWADEGERRGAYNQAALDRAGEMHPVIAAFVREQHPDRLRLVAVDDPEWGHARREELRLAYERLCSTRDDRELAAIARDGRHDGLRRFDPVAALGLENRRLATPGPVETVEPYQSHNPE